MEEHRRRQSNATRAHDANQDEESSSNEKLFSAIVLADAARPACQAAFEAMER
jgi:hypothetical protein